MGKSRANEFIGQVVNGQKIIEVSQKEYPSGRKQLVFDCICTYCGVSKQINTYVVYASECGCDCLGKGKMVFRPRSPMRYFNQFKANRNRRGMEFGLSFNDLMNLFDNQNGLCALSGEVLSFDEGTASIDRIDNSRGYTLDNIQWVHRHINFMKNELPQELFIYLCNRVSDYMQISHPLS